MFSKGFTKVAATVRGAYVGAKAGLKTMSSPRRVSGPTGALKNLRDLTGHSASDPFVRRVRRKAIVKPQGAK